MIDTNESRQSRDRLAIREGSHLQRDHRGRVRLFRGYRYRCPRCGWKSRVLRSRVGATFWADRHQRECVPRA